MSTIANERRENSVNPYVCIGMPHKDLIGQTFERWIVVSFAEKRRCKPYWVCRCVCGVTKTIRGSALIAGKSRSCGCLMSDVAKTHNMKRRGADPWVAEMNTHAYRIGWDRKNKKCAEHKTWSLTLEQFKRLSISSCYYCGRDPSTKPTTRILRSTGVKRNGIDRVNNMRGYGSDNCVTCCESCNREKGQQKHCDFVENTIRRYRHMERIGLEKFGTSDPTRLWDGMEKS